MAELILVSLRVRCVRLAPGMCDKELAGRPGEEIQQKNTHGNNGTMLESCKCLQLVQYHSPTVGELSC